MEGQNFNAYIKKRPSHHKSLEKSESKIIILEKKSINENIMYKIMWDETYTCVWEQIENLLNYWDDIVNFEIKNVIIEQHKILKKINKNKNISADEWISKYFLETETDIMNNDLKLVENTTLKIEQSFKNHKFEIFNSVCLEKIDELKKKYILFRENFIGEPKYIEKILNKKETSKFLGDKDIIIESGKICLKQDELKDDSEIFFFIKWNIFRGQKNITNIISTKFLKFFLGDWLVEFYESLLIFDDRNSNENNDDVKYILN